MTDKPKYSADPSVYLEEKGISGDTMIDYEGGAVYLHDILQSYANQEVKKACEKQRELCAAHYLMYRIEVSEHATTMNDYYTRKCKEKIKNAPSPQD